MRPLLPLYCSHLLSACVGQMYADREAMKRQSTVLLATAESDTRLMQALLQIELLTNELETAKQESKEKVYTGASLLSPLASLS